MAEPDVGELGVAAAAPVLANGTPTPPAPGPLVVIGPRTQAQLLALLERQAAAILVAALEANGQDVEAGWALRGELRLERVGHSSGPANGAVGP